MARPEKFIDWDKVRLRMEAGNSAKVIAAHHNIDTDTFYKRFKQEFGCSFGDYSALFYQCGNENLLYTQYVKALSGNVQLLIHLGKVRLGQKEDFESNESLADIVKADAQLITQT